MVEKRIAARVLLSLLNSSRKKSVKPIKVLAEEAGVPKKLARSIIERIAAEGPSDGIVLLPEDRRVDIAVKVATMGVPLEEISNALTPKDFEDFTSRVLENVGFEVRPNFSFKISGRRHQIDVLALRDTILLSIDCKRWRQGFSFKKIQQHAESQVERTRCLTKYLGRIHNPGHVGTILVPVVIGLKEPPRRIIGRCPIVPIHTLASFIFQVEPFVHDIEKCELRTDRKLILSRL